ncbi:MAG: hypothetical protein LAT67_15315 [Balneolales bacterium]|nr:hypothetical protein [Balneolales bacterium]
MGLRVFFGIKALMEEVFSKPSILFVQTLNKAGKKISGFFTSGFIRLSIILIPGAKLSLRYAGVYLSYGMSPKADLINIF